MTFAPKPFQVKEGKTIVLHPACPVCGYSMMLVDWAFDEHGRVHGLYQCHSDFCGGGEHELDGEGKVIGTPPKKLRLT